MHPWVIYSLARVGIFLALLVVLLVLGIEWWIAAIAATLMALAISYLALGRLRNRVAEDLFEPKTLEYSSIQKEGGVSFIHFMRFEDEAAEDGD